MEPQFLPAAATASPEMRERTVEFPVSRPEEVELVKSNLQQIRSTERYSSAAIEEGWRQNKMQRSQSQLLFGGQNLFILLPRQLICTRTILKKRTNSYFSKNHPGTIHSILRIVLVENSQRGKKFTVINSVHQKVVRTVLPFLLSLSLFYVSSFVNL